MATTRGPKPQMPDNVERKIALTEIGISGLKRVGGFVYDEYLKALQGYRAAVVYREMYDNDPVIGGLMFAIEQTVVDAGWDVKAADDTNDGPSNKALEQAEFVKSCMADMSHTWSDFLYEVLTFLPHGWSWMEKVYKIRRGPDQQDGSLRSRFTDGKYGWRKIALRSQDTLYRWEFDEFGGVQEMYQIAPPDFATRIIPIEKSLLFRVKSNRRNPEGRSVLRNAYVSYYFRKRIQELEGIGVERDHVGLPVLTSPENFDSQDPENQPQLTRAEALLRNLKVDEQAGVLLPAGWTLELVSAQGRKLLDANAIIDRYDRRIAMSILGQFIMLGMGNVGSFALSSVQQDVFLLAVTGWLRSIADVMNRYAIPRLMDLNGIAPELAPEFRYAEVRQPDLQHLGQFLMQVTQAGLLTPDDDLENRIREIAKLPIKEEDESAAEPDAEPGSREEVLPDAAAKAALAVGDRRSWPASRLWDPQRGRRTSVPPKDLQTTETDDPARRLGAEEWARLALRPYRAKRARKQYGVRDLVKLYEERERQRTARADRILNG